MGVVRVGLGAAMAMAALLLPGPGSSTLPAQEMPDLRLESRVRVRSPALLHRWQEGTLVDRSPTTLTVRPEGGGRLLELDLDEVRELEVATGRHRGWARGGFTGLWSGLVLGLIIFEIDEADDEIDPECGELQCFEAPFFVAMSLGGAAVGAGVGALFHVTEWTEVPLDRVRVSAGLSGGGPGGPGASGGPPVFGPGLTLRLELVF